MASLEQTLQETTEERDLAIKNKNSLSFLGIQMNKAFYNSIMWIIILALAVLLVILFLLFKRSFTVTRQTTKDLEETREEFESYRQQSRERYEKLVVQHHQEVLKLKGKRPRSIE
jgi:flagellar biosynthesis/type III secretory pathway M-ring protein FliF/YscJ